MRLIIYGAFDLLEIVFEFKIDGKGSGVYGDGMALWITKERAQTGTVFGFVDKFEGLGVFIDTYQNGRPGTTFPYVMAMLGDGRTSYDVEHDGKANEVGGCSVQPVASFADFRRVGYEGQPPQPRGD